MKCLNCNEEWNNNSVLNFLINKKYYVCEKCRILKPLHSVECGVSWYSLFYYRGAARMCVIKSKLSKKCLFSKHIKKSRVWPLLKDRLWIIPPSSRKDNHLIKTVKSLGVDYQECFEKIKQIKQSKQNLKNRKTGNLKLIEVPKRIDILLFDDTSTTGFTIREMIEHIGDGYNIIVFSFCTNKITI